MYPVGYFAPRYFAPRYFPEVGDVLVFIPVGADTLTITEQTRLTVSTAPIERLALRVTERQRITLEITEND